MKNSAGTHSVISAESRRWNSLAVSQLGGRFGEDPFGFAQAKFPRRKTWCGRSHSNLAYQSSRIIKVSEKHSTLKIFEHVQYVGSILSRIRALFGNFQTFHLKI